MEYGDAVFVVAFLTISVITIIGNILVILAVLSNRRLQNPANYLMMNLAVSDFFQGAISFPLRSAEVLNTSEEKLIRCDVVIAVTILFHSASNFNLALIALDRFIAVWRPFAYANVVKTSRYKIVIGLSWLCCLLLSGSIVVGWRENEPKGAGNVCRFSTTLTEQYIIMYVFLVDLMPLFVMILTYTYIFRTTRRQISQIRAQEIAVKHANINQAFESRRPSEPNWAVTDDSGPGTSKLGAAAHVNPIRREDSSAGETCNNNNNNDENNQSNATQREIKKSPSRQMSRQISLSTTRTRKATKTVLAIIGFFLVLCMPISIIDAIELWCKSCSKIPSGVITAALCMAASNSCINVFVYGGYNTDYRKAYWNVWRRTKDVFSNIFIRTKTTVQSAQASTT